MFEQEHEHAHLPAGGGTLSLLSEPLPLPGLWKVVVNGGGLRGRENGTKKYENTSAGDTASTWNDGSGKACADHTGKQSDAVHRHGKIPVVASREATHPDFTKLFLLVNVTPQYRYLTGKFFTIYLCMRGDPTFSKEKIERSADGCATCVRTTEYCRTEQRRASWLNM